jgi:hypothetical protein
MFNAARGSILVAALFHFQMNNPAWPPAQPWENFVWATVAVVIVLLNRRRIVSGDGAVTEALMPRQAGSLDKARINATGLDSRLPERTVE